MAKDNTPLLIGLGVAGAAAWGWFVLTLPPKRKASAATPASGGGVAKGAPGTTMTLNREAVRKAALAFDDKPPVGFNADGLPICAAGYQPVLVGERWACRPIANMS